MIKLSGVTVGIQDFQVREHRFFGLKMSSARAIEVLDDRRIGYTDRNELLVEPIPEADG